MNILAIGYNDNDNKLIDYIYESKRKVKNDLGGSTLFKKKLICKELKKYQINIGNFCIYLNK